MSINPTSALSGYNSILSEALVKPGKATLENMRQANAEFNNTPPTESVEVVDKPKPQILDYIEGKKDPNLEQISREFFRPMGSISDPVIPPKAVVEAIEKYKNMFKEKMTVGQNLNVKG